MPLRRLARALDPRTLVRNAQKVESLRTSTKALHHELLALRGALAALTEQLGAVQSQMDQLAVLRREELDAAARLDRLEHVLDGDRVRFHAREALARSAVIEDPVPHAIISELLPADVYDAVIEAIPPEILFEYGAAGWGEVRVPPRLAPSYSAATWAFFAELVNDVLAPAIVERFQGPLDRHISALCPSLRSVRDAGIVLSASAGRIVLRRPVDDPPGSRTRPWHFLTMIVYLARRHDGEEYGSRLRRVDTGGDSQGPGDARASGTAKNIPFRANSALVALDPTGAHEYVAIPITAPADTRRYSGEFSIGPVHEMRRKLMARMDDATRRAWEVLE